MTTANEQRAVTQENPEEELPENLPPLRRLTRVSRRWEKVVSDLFQALPDALLTEIVSEAESTTLVWTMEELGLGSQWKKLSKLKYSRRAAFAPLVKRFREQLDAYGGKYCPAVTLIFGWWGRRADIHLTPLALKEFLASKPLRERIAYCDEWMRSHGSQEDREAVQHRLLELKDSSQVLDRMFADLVLCVAQGLSPESFEQRARLWASSVALGTQSAGEQPDTPKKETAASVPAAPVAAVPSPQASPAPAEAAAPRPSSPPTPSPEPLPSPTPSPEPPPQVPLAMEPTALEVAAPASSLPPLLPEVETLRALLVQIQAATREGAELLTRGRINQALELRDRLLSLQALIAQNLRVLEERLTAQDVESPGPLPEPAFSQPAVGEEYLAVLNACLLEADVRGTRLLQQRRTALVAEFEGLGLRPPEDLSGIKTLREFQERGRVLKPLLDEQRALQQLLSPSGTVAREARESLPLLKRLEFYERTALELRHPQASRTQRGPKELLEAVLRDGAALAHEPARGRRLMASALIALLEQELPVPPGTWRLFSSLCEAGGVVERLRELDVLTCLAAVPESLHDAEGLFEVVGQERECLPTELRDIFVRIEIARLPLPERIPRLAAMALDGQLAESLLMELLRALVQQGRHSDAVLLAILALQASRRFQLDLAYESLLVFLVEQAERDSSAHEFIGQNFLQDSNWLCERTEDVVVLLYLVIRTGNRGPFENLQFLKPELLRDTERARPALVGRWLMPELKSRAPVDHQARRETLRVARQSLRDWDHDLRKESCYRSWDYASDYQRLFKDHLTRLFEELDRARTFQDFDPLVFIEELGREHRLPEARHPALPPMKKYLLEQVDRLRLIERALPYLGDVPIRQGLSQEEPDLRSELDREFRQSPASPALRHIYQRAMERL
jgi:hypothetical protein